MIYKQYKDSNEGECPVCHSSHVHTTGEITRVDTGFEPDIAISFECKKCGKKFYGLYSVEFIANAER